MSASVFKPIIMDVQRIRSPTCDKKYAFSRGPPKVRRVLFGPIDHEQTQQFLDDELAKHSIKEQEQWEFDFHSERPCYTKGRFEWYKILNVPVDKTRPTKRRKPEENNDVSEYYAQRKDLIRPLPVRPAETDSSPREEFSIKKQLKITDFMNERKRPAFSAFAKKSEASTSSSRPPEKMARSAS